MSHNQTINETPIPFRYAVMKSAHSPAFAFLKINGGNWAMPRAI